MRLNRNAMELKKYLKICNLNKFKPNTYTEIWEGEK